MNFLNLQPMVTSEQLKNVKFAGVVTQLKSCSESKKIVTHYIFQSTIHPYFDHFSSSITASICTA